ncbi:hypothetical protein CRG98_043963 [Punica granatum]|uniref:Uncharacterized protein n=1 Tax=Punica granatum TaxID=22663 RepID=A0A2I0HWI5_PUNGR|nr:hypothetical protein CRG98_043963 [Punica granatum]
MGRGWQIGPTGPSLQRKRNGPRSVSRIVAGIGGQRRHEAGGGDSRLWTPRRRHERVREIALGAAWPRGVWFGLHRGRNGRNRGSFRDFPASVPNRTDLQILSNESQFFLFFLWVPSSSPN